MEGTTHGATTAIVAALLGVAVHRAYGTFGVSPGSVIGHDLLFAAAGAGLGLVPDSDHTDASFAHVAGPVTHGLTHIIATLAGGHRYGMHSILGTALMCCLTAAGTLWYPGRWDLLATGIVLALFTGAGLASTGFTRHGLSAIAAGAVIAALCLVWVRPELWWLVATGMTVHITEDCFTGRGCALLYPWRRRFRFGHQPPPPKKAKRRAVTAKTPRALPAAGPAALVTGSDGRSRDPRWLALSGECAAGDCGQCTGKAREVCMHGCHEAGRP
jgi:membrane-bound metal-dependent hydrolase YbcI (DUF457 family)